MEYEIYIDSVFFSNFALNFLVLSLTDMGLRIRKGFKCRLLGSLLGAIFYCVFLMLPIPIIWIRVLLGSLISGLLLAVFTTGSRSMDRMKRRLEEMLHYSLILSGLMFCMNRFLPFLNGVFGMLALAIGSYELIRRVKERWNACKVTSVQSVLKDHGVTVPVRTLLDTGNGLVEPISGKPACVVQKEAAVRLWKDLDAKMFRAIPFHSVGSNGIMKGYSVEQILVEYKGRRICLDNIYLAVEEGSLGSKEDYDLIVNPRIFEK